MKKTFDSVELMRSIRSELDREIEKEGLRKWLLQIREKVKHIKLWNKLRQRQIPDKQ